MANLTQSNNVATLNKINAGVITLTANITTYCQYSFQKVSTLVIGTPTPSITAEKITPIDLPTEYRFTAPLLYCATYNWYGNNELIESNVYPLNVLEWYFPPLVRITIKCNISNTCGTSPYSNSIIKRGDPVPTGATQVSNYSIYPNPASSEITISQAVSTLSISSTETKKPKAIKSIKIMDNFGTTRIVKNFGNETLNAKINLSTLPTGSYLIRVNEGIEAESYTIFKN
jgi:hypothetical protein